MRSNLHCTSRTGGVDSGVIALDQLKAIVQPPQVALRPDASWIKRNVPVLDVARKLDLNIRENKTNCWQTGNHRHGDANPSLGFHVKRNRWRCFVCDTKGGHSNIDLVMGVLDCDFGSAVRWIAERFAVPNVKVGRPSAKSFPSATPYRAGVLGSDWEVVLRSGMWGLLSAAERSILFTLHGFQDAETGVTRLSYRAIMRYSGVAKPGNVSNAIKELRKLHALQSVPGLRSGVMRQCSTYRVTLADPKFLEMCNQIFAEARSEIALERQYRASLKAQRQRDARKPSGPTLQNLHQNRTKEGGFHPPAPPVSLFSNSKTKPNSKRTTACEGLSLSSPGEVLANNSLPAGKREINTPDDTSFLKLQRDKEYILRRYPAAGHRP
jgi:hypothetical protein